MKLIDVINVAAERKPSFGDKCNHCGWCCLTEVCHTGKVVSGSGVIPCSLLVSKEDGRHYCQLMIDSPDAMAPLLGAGSGCDAMTGEERFRRFNEC